MNRTLIKLNQIVNKILPVAGFSLIAFYGFKFGYKSYHLNYYRATTSGRIETIYLDWRNDKTITFSFKVDGVEYKGAAWFYDNIQPKVGDVFQVRYSTRDPSTNEMIFE